MSEHRLTYSDVGVDVDLGEGFVQAIAQAVKSTHDSQKGRILEGASDFAGLFRLGGGYEDPVLVSGTDGVGTKLLLAQEFERHDSVGIDLVAMCVNDILTTGAEPLFFLDYIATGQIDQNVLKVVLSGIAQGCREAGCALVGGETAEMPDMYEPGVYDLAGFAVGVVERKNLDNKMPVKAGDAILALPSSGIHSNGYSLVRKVFGSKEKRDVAAQRLGVSIEDVLLEPTRIYAKGAKSVLGEEGISGIAHITGGGIPGNVSRVIPDDLQANFHPEKWAMPEIFPLIQEFGPVESVEMYRTFNMGLGFVFLVRAEQAESLLESLKNAGEQAMIVGEVVKKTRGGHSVAIEGI